MEVVLNRFCVFELDPKIKNMILPGWQSNCPHSFGKTVPFCVVVHCFVPFRRLDTISPVPLHILHCYSRTRIVRSQISVPAPTPSLAPSPPTAPPRTSFPTLIYHLRPPRHSILSCSQFLCLSIFNSCLHHMSLVQLPGLITSSLLFPHLHSERNAQARQEIC